MKSIEKRVSDFLDAYYNLMDVIHYPKKKDKDILICPLCGESFLRDDKGRHIKTKRHIEKTTQISKGEIMPYFIWADVEEAHFSLHESEDELLESNE